MNKPQAFTYSVTTPPRLVDRTQFENIIIRSDENGGALRLKDVARVELGALAYGFSGTFNGSPAVPIARLPAARRQRAAGRGRRQGDDGDIAKRFPVGLRYDIPFDTTRFVEVSIEEVAITFVEAIVLVVLVVFLFLQSVRAMIIPVIAIPVSIIGTFAGMYAAGLLDQPADAVRAGAGHRHRRRRRHRRAGERRAHHVDRGQGAARRRASRPCRR